MFSVRSSVCLFLLDSFHRPSSLTRFINSWTDSGFQSRLGTGLDPTGELRGDERFEIAPDSEWLPFEKTPVPRCLSFHLLRHIANAARASPPGFSCVPVPMPVAFS